MSDSESATDIENYRDAEELDDFIDYSDEEQQRGGKENVYNRARKHKLLQSNQEYADFDQEEQLGLGGGGEAEEEEQEEEEMEEDKIRALTTTLKPNETQAQKLLKAHIAVLVSALGGIDHTSEIVPPPYKLGHDALACLKDIKRWIRAVDERQHNYEVALACAESGLVQNDLIIILCQWDSQMQNKKQKTDTMVRNKTAMEKIMLSCLEILVLLTWPMEFGTNLSENQKLLFAQVRKIQVLHKKHILTYNDGQVLKAVIRLALPVIAKPRIDREPRDNQILRLVLYFARNLLAIEPENDSISTKTNNKRATPSSNLPNGVSPDDISINNLLRVFKKNKVLMLLLTITGSINSEFEKDLFNEICLESVYLLIKGLEAKDVLVNKPTSTSKVNTKTAAAAATTTNTTSSVDISATTPLQPLSSTVGLQLQDLLNTEAKKRQSQKQHIATRHGKFGTLLSIRSADANSYVVSGEEALINPNGTMDKLDKSKTWKMKNHFTYDSDEFVKTNSPIYLNAQGRQILSYFIEEFLSGGCFNNLIESMTSKLTSQLEYSLIDELTQASYFYTIAWFLNYQREQITLSGLQTFDFGVVRAALSEVNFILIVAYFRDSHQKRLWNSLHVAMICFKELLHISNSIFGKKRARTTNDDTIGDDEQYEIDRELAEGIIRKLFSFNEFLNTLVQVPQIAYKHSPRFLAESIRVITIILKSFESFAKEDLQLYVQTKRKRNKKKQQRINELDRDTESKLRTAIYESDEELAQENLREVTRERKLNFQATEVRFFHQNVVTTYIEYMSRFEDLTHEDIKMCLTYFHKLFVVRKDYNGLFRLDFMQLIYKLRNHLPKGSPIRLKVDEFIYYFMKKFKLAITRFPNPLEILFPRFEETRFKHYLSTGELYELDTAVDPRAIRNLNKEVIDNDYNDAVDNDNNNDNYNEDDEDGIAFEIEANPEAADNHAYDLDRLDELESQLTNYQSRNKNRSSLEKGIAKKRNSRKKSTKTSKVNSDGDDNDDDDDDAAAAAAAKAHRKRRVPRDLLFEEPKPLRSAEFINDSDDESDDEKNAEFFAREERLRQLLNQTGNITDAQKLEEFKKVWQQYSKTGGSIMQDAVANAVKEVSLFISDGDDDDDDDDGNGNENQKGKRKRTRDEADDFDGVSTILDSVQSQVLDNGSSQGNFASDAEVYHASSNTSDTELETNKRAKIDGAEEKEDEGKGEEEEDDNADEDEDEDEDVDGEESFPVVHHKKKRAIISDDEE